jgi:hypothetical protein
MKYTHPEIDLTAELSKILPTSLMSIIYLVMNNKFSQIFQLYPCRSTHWVLISLLPIKILGELLKIFPTKGDKPCGLGKRSIKVFVKG